MTSYKEIKEECLRSGKLFEDDDFPASNRLLLPSHKNRWVQWRRPQEITTHPKFINKSASRFDLDQGELGDCWFVAAAASLAAWSKKILHRCVPPDQDFEKDYAGIFRFYLWRFDKWVEVVVDDRLPTTAGRLLYASNSDDPKEFWSALLEKAYAKVNGSYSSLHGGQLNDALVDFTGGISEVIKLDSRSVPQELHEHMNKAAQMNSLMGAAINGSSGTEEELSNGLYKGHAYSLTGFTVVKEYGQDEQLIRVRNPWGKGEWNGDWSDTSYKWKNLSDEVKKKLRLDPREDGEFWMTYEDWYKNFDELQMCHLHPDAVTQEVAEDMKKSEWKVVKHHGEWMTGLSAGGCGRPPHQDLFWDNPQFRLDIVRNTRYSKRTVSVIASLMQKPEDVKNKLHIGFQVWKLKRSAEVPLDAVEADGRTVAYSTSSHSYTNAREVTLHMELDPGAYVIVPSTYNINKDGEFLLRIYTETEATSEKLDVPSKPIPQPGERETTREIFYKYTSGESQMDAEDLSDLLNDVFKEDLGKHKFGVESARGVLAMMDRDQTGLLEITEFKKMMKELDVWKRAFQNYDTNRSGSIDTYELKQIFKAIGFSVNISIVAAIVKRYGGKHRKLNLVDFLHCCSKVVVMYQQFIKRSTTGIDGKVEINFEDWLGLIIFV